MKPETILHGGVGAVGTLLAFVTPERVGMGAGLCTIAWMLWQLGCSIYDRCTRRRRPVAPSEP